MTLLRKTTPRVISRFNALHRRRERFRKAIDSARTRVAKYYGVSVDEFPKVENVIFRSMNCEEIRDTVRQVKRFGEGRTMPKEWEIKLIAFLGKIQGITGIAHHVFMGNDIYVPSLYGQLFLPNSLVPVVMAHEFVHVLQNHTRLSILSATTGLKLDGKLYSAAFEGLATRVHGAILDEMEESGEMNWKEKLKGKIYDRVSRYVGYLFCPVQIPKSILRTIIRSVLSNKKLLRLIDWKPKIFSFLIQPYQDGKRFVEEVEELIGDRKKAFDFICEFPPHHARDIFEPKQYVDFYMEHR